MLVMRWREEKGRVCTLHPSQSFLTLLLTFIPLTCPIPAVGGAIHAPRSKSRNGACVKLTSGDGEWEESVERDR